jgi:hypothetical protein
MADSVLEWICTRLNQISVAGRCQYKVAPAAPARFVVCGGWRAVGYVLCINEKLSGERQQSIFEAE